MYKCIQECVGEGSIGFYSVPLPGMEDPELFKEIETQDLKQLTTTKKHSGQSEYYQTQPQCTE